MILQETKRALGNELTEAEVREAYERFGPLVRRRCQTLLRDRTLAEDACHNAFSKLIRYGSAFRQAESRLGWLYRVADNCCFDLLRARRRWGSLDQVVEEAAADPEQQRVEERRQALAVLSVLDETLQRVAVWHYVDEMSQGQIAERLGCSRQTVNAKLERLRRKVRGE